MGDPEDGGFAPEGGKGLEIETRVELKAMVALDAVDDVMEGLDLRSDDAEEREIWFYDDADFSHIAEGVILRARKKKDDDDDSTVKLRPATAEEWYGWLNEDGFKCEEDRSPSKTVTSCSWTTEQDRGEIDDVGDGERDIDKLFSRDQEDFAAAGWGGELDWDELEAWGPIASRVWKLRPDGFDKVKAETWDLSDGRRLLELSTRVDAQEADAAWGAFLQLIYDWDVPLDFEGTTKTRAALESFRQES